MEEAVARICSEKENELQATVSLVGLEVVRAYNESEQYLKDLTNLTGEMILEHRRESQREIDSVSPGVP